LKVFDVSLEMSGDPKNYFGLPSLTLLKKHQILFISLIDDFCQAFSLFETMTGSLISQMLSIVMLLGSQAPNSIGIQLCKIFLLDQGEIKVVVVPKIIGRPLPAKLSQMQGENEKYDGAVKKSGDFT